MNISIHSIITGISIIIVLNALTFNGINNDIDNTTNNVINHIINDISIHIITTNC